jgi:hypothetical protein
VIGPTFLNVDNVSDGTYELDEINQHCNGIDCYFAQQNTLLWNEDKYLEISPDQNVIFITTIYDEHAEELSFPNMYLEQGITFKMNVKVTPFMIATNNIPSEG